MKQLYVPLILLLASLTLAGQAPATFRASQRSLKQCKATFTPAGLNAAARAKELVIRFEVSAAMPGELALYGERFGRYPL